MTEITNIAADSRQGNVTSYLVATPTLKATVAVRKSAKAKITGKRASEMNGMEASTAR